MEDSGFACVVLGVLAVASRYCADPQVLAKVPHGLNLSKDTLTTTEIFHQWIDDLEGANKGALKMENASRMSAGWKYYNRMQQKLTFSMDEISLNELQTFHVCRLVSLRFSLINTFFLA